MSVSLKKFSRLRFSDLLTVDGVEFWDMFVPPEIPVQADDIPYTVTQTDRIDLLADTYYGDPILWFVIALANNMELVPTALVSGVQIRIPSPRFVTRELFDSRKVRQ